MLDQRLFIVSGNKYEVFKELLDSQVQDNAGLRELFTRKAPWDTK